MAKGSDTKLYVAAGLLAVLGGAFYWQKQEQKKETAAHTVAGAAQDLPKVEFSEEAKGKVTKLVIEKPAKAGGEDGEKAEPAVRHVLVKEGETWRLVEPLAALANQNNVESALTNLTKVSVKERVASGSSAYEMYDLTDDKAIHVQAYEGDKVVLELWSGKSGGRGQMARLAGQDGVFSLDGFSSYSYARDTKGWRDLKIVEVDTDAVTEISIASETGEFAFAKSASAPKKDEKAEGDAEKDDKDAEKAAWSGKFKKAKGGALAAIKDFDGGKVLDMLRAYKVLNATAFGDGKTPAETGLEKPLSVVTIKSAGGETRLLFGTNSEGSARWVKVEGRDAIYAVGSWAADWAFAEESKFQKKADAKKDAGEEAALE